MIISKVGMVHAMWCFGVVSANAWRPAGSDMDVESTGPVSIQATAGTLDLTAGQDLTLSSTDGNMQFEAAAAMQLSAGTDLSMVADDSINIASTSGDVAVSATHGRMDIAGVDGLSLAATGGTCLDGGVPAPVATEDECTSAGHLWVPSAYVAACSGAVSLSDCDAVVHDGASMCEFIESCTPDDGTSTCEGR